MGEVLIVLLLDIAVPLAIAVVLSVMNARGRRNRRSEVDFWLLTGGYAVVFSLLAYTGVVSVNETHGYALVGAVVFALPASILAVIIHLTLAFGLGVAMAPEITMVFGVALVCWSILNFVVARRIRQAVHRRRLRTQGWNVEGFRGQ